MVNVKVLDCTLRDGGYINDWNFGDSNIKNILEKLIDSNIDIIECGYLSKKNAYRPGKSIFDTVERVRKYIPKDHRKTSLACMMNFGEYNIDELPDCDGSSIDSIRVAFHKKDAGRAIEFCKQIKAKGYSTYIQAMVTQSYSDEELLRLIKSINEFTPRAFYIVDTFGTMRKKDVMRMFYLIDNNLDKDIAIGFHSHNNMQLSFSNAQELMELHTSREMIIDSSVNGMGRGAGNLCSELLGQYINENLGERYNLIPLLEIIDDYLNPIFIKLPWGYSVPYYVASINKCHPNYATYLINKQTLTIKDINCIISSMENDKRTLYDKEYIEDLYTAYLARTVNDNETLEMLKEKLTGREVLILAPGKSLKTEKEAVQAAIDMYSPVVFAINFIPDFIDYNCLFINNLKRFNGIADFYNSVPKDKVTVVTSNIISEISPDEISHSDISPKINIINYANYTNSNPEVSDNALLMILALLNKLGVKKVLLAGFDGFKINRNENYFDDKFINIVETEELLNRNVEIKKELDSFRQTMDIHFVTSSLYEVRHE